MNSDVMETLSRTTRIGEESRFRRILSRNHSKGTERLSQSEDLCEVTLVIRGIQEKYVFHPRSAAMLIGRAHHESSVVPDIDLALYGAYERGVSRVHAKLEMAKGNRIYITDMDSTNGTYIGGIRIKPRRPYLLHHEDRVVLGTLAIQVLFETCSS
jgi:pSer/pThr/pTyr-binding forkhead associated (FHA) protein